MNIHVTPSINARNELSLNLFGTNNDSEVWQPTQHIIIHGVDNILKLRAACDEVIAGFKKPKTHVQPQP